MKKYFVQNNLYCWYMSIHYLWWVPVVLLWYMVYAWISKLNNDLRTSGIFINTLLFGICPFWAIVSRISKNIIFDGMLYDIIIFTSYLLTMGLLGAGKDFTAFNWLGAGLIITGFILMKI